VWRRELIGFFSDNPEIVAIGAGVMICAAVFQVFDGMGIIYTNALRGAGDTLWPSVMFVVSHWLILIGGGYCIARYAPGSLSKRDVSATMRARSVPTRRTTPAATASCPM